MRAFRIVLIAALAALTPRLLQAQWSAPTTQATVVWISIDGFRHDYLQRFHPPALSRLAKEGAFTTQERPIFPSLTFPNHIAQVTGTTADKNGIPMNAFFDPAIGQQFSFPDEGSELRAEPIWITAKRQGLRVVTIDWPMSHGQVGEWKSDFFEATFDMKRTDGQRLEHVVQLLNDDVASGKQPPPRLIITYMSHIDTVGHRSGPDSKEIELAVLEADTSIDRLLKSITNWFDQVHHGAADAARRIDIGESRPDVVEPAPQVFPGGTDDLRRVEKLLRFRL